MQRYLQVNDKKCRELCITNKCFNGKIFITFSQPQMELDGDGEMFKSTIIIYDAHNCHQISYNFQIFNFDCVKSCTIIVVVVVDIDNDPGNHFITNVI